MEYKKYKIQMETADVYFPELDISLGDSFVTETPPDVCLSLEDKDFIDCWNNNDPFTHYFLFYDKINNCTFTSEGNRNGPKYDNYKKNTLVEWVTNIKNSLVN